MNENTAAEMQCSKKKKKKKNERTPNLVTWY